jgi:predicted DNA-binding ribbon-helix-helix protein
VRPIAEKTARLSVSLNQGDYDALQRVAERNDVSVAWLVRKSIERFLESSAQGDLFRSTEVAEVVRR